MTQEQSSAVIHQVRVFTVVTEVRQRLPEDLKDDGLLMMMISKMAWAGESSDAIVLHIQQTLRSRRTETQLPKIDF